MKRDKWLLIGISALLVSAFLWGARWYRQKEVKQSEATVSVHTESLVRYYSPVMGPESAPVTMVEFFDPECEACGMLYPMVKELMGEFDGKVRLVVRYMPLHKNSVYAASILEGAKKQGKFWEALEVMFKKQPEWASHQAPKPELLLGYMRELGLDMERLNASLADHEPRSRIQQDQEDGMKLGVNRTPTFFVNGKMVQEIGREQMRAAIRAGLK